MNLETNSAESQNWERNLTEVIIKDIKFKLDRDNHIAFIFSCKPCKSNIFIPRSIKYKATEYLVTSILKQSFERSFYHKNNIQSIKFDPNSELHTIGKNAFAGTQIKEIILPIHVQRICEGCFMNCSSLKKVEFPKNSELQIIEKDAFALSSIECLIIPSSVSQFEDGWCNTTLKLTKIKIIENEIKNIVYYEDKFLIGKSDTKSDSFDSLYFARRDLTSATIPSFIRYIKPYSFSQCNFKTIEFPENSELKIIQNFSFYYSNIEAISFPLHLTSIQNNAFGMCTKFKSIEFPKNSELQTIEKEAFNRCQIEYFTFPSGVCQLEEGWCSRLSELTNIKIIENEIKNIVYYEDKFLIGKSDSKSDNFDSLYFARRDLTSAIIPSFIRYIKPYSFEQCCQLETIEFPENSELKSIEKFSFYQSAIKNISLPVHITEIGDYAFYFSNLKRVRIHKNSEIRMIGKLAFDNSSIEWFSIPINITIIKEKSFAHCNKLKMVEVSEKSKLQVIENEAFYKSAIEKFSIPSCLTVISEFSFALCLNLKIFTIPSNSELREIKKHAFLSSAIESFVIPNHVTEIGDQAFLNCNNLQIVEIEENAKIDSSVIINAFNNKNALIMIPTKFNK